MRDYETGLTQERLKELLHYDPETGDFTWKVSRGGVKKGSVAGFKKFNSGRNRKSRKPHHISISINGFNYSAHRLAWLYMTGEWPNIIDHDDQDPFNNKWTNLNNGSIADNNKNRTLRSDNTSGITGVCWNKTKWKSSIYKSGKYICLGHFAKLDDAVKVRKEAELKYGYHPNHGR